MTREALIELHAKMVADAGDLLRAKNHDYCKTDAFTNLKMCEAMGICSAEQGIVIRLTDKISRLSSVLEKGAQVKTESVRDTCLDVINYAVLLYAQHCDRALTGETAREAR